MQEIGWRHRFEDIDTVHVHTETFGFLGGRLTIQLFITLFTFYVLHFDDIIVIAMNYRC